MAYGNFPWWIIWLIVAIVLIILIVILIIISASRIRNPIGRLPPLVVNVTSDTAVRVSWTSTDPAIVSGDIFNFYVTSQNPVNFRLCRSSILTSLV